MAPDEEAKNEPYIAILLYESASDASDYVPLYREDVVLLWAANPEAATRRAEQRGELAETSYRNRAGETITWKLKHIIDVTSALEADLGVDADLHSRHFRDYQAYRSFEPFLSGSIE